MNVAAAMEERRSIRRFLPDPVPDAVLDRLFRLARRAPSGANLQPGQIFRVRGEVRSRLTGTLLDAYRARAAEPEDYDYFPHPMPPHLKRRQIEAAKALYEAVGVSRQDRAGRDAQFERNFAFFDAPVALVVTIEAGMGAGCYMDLGMMLYGLMLAATGEGLASCGIGALASYPSPIRRTLGLDETHRIVCGLAIGRPDPAAPENRVRTARLTPDEFVTILG